MLPLFQKCCVPVATSVARIALQEEIEHCVKLHNKSSKSAAVTGVLIFQLGFPQQDQETICLLFAFFGKSIIMTTSICRES